MPSPPFQGPYHFSNHLLYTLSRVEAVVTHVVAQERRYVRNFQTELEMVGALEKTPKELMNDVLKELVVRARVEKREMDGMRVFEGAKVVKEMVSVVKRARARVGLE